MQLNEGGLRPNVLKDLIYDIVSVDEFTPKIDDDNIVVQFQVLDNYDAAYDLSSFLERAPINALDTEAAEIPNIDGKYEVFVEFERDAEFPVKFLKMLTLIENLSAGVPWKLQIYEHNDPMELNDANLEELIRLTSEEDVEDFFVESFSKVKLLGESIKIEGVGRDMFYSKASGKVSESYVKELLESVRYDESGLSSVLGDKFTVVESKGSYICSNGKSYFILR